VGHATVSELAGPAGPDVAKSEPFQLAPVGYPITNACSADELMAAATGQYGIIVPFEASSHHQKQLQLPCWQCTPHVGESIVKGCY
jgi:hypothetical protein